MLSKAPTIEKLHFHLCTVYVHACNGLEQANSKTPVLHSLLMTWSPLAFQVMCYPISTINLAFVFVIVKY